MSEETIRRELVLAALREHAPRAVHVAELCGRLGVPVAQRAEVEAVLDHLVEAGLAREMPGARYRSEKRPRQKDPFDGTLTGRLGMNARGFGFVAAEDGGPDVFVHAGALGGAMHGDRVRVSAQKSAKGREGQVVEVIERATKRVAGVLVRGPRGYVLESQDQRMRGSMIVEGKLAIGAKPGLMVIGEITKYPDHPDDAPTVAIVQALGRPGSATVEIEAIKVRDNIVEEFGADVLAEAALIPSEVPEADKASREDLRKFDLVTIDPDDARDHDDAIWGERLPNGGWRVIIAIADVSHYVREGTAIDREALARGCSVYLPDRAIPMLPPELSSRLASLVPNVDRLTLAVEVELGASGNIQRYRTIEGVMRSGARLTYGGVAKALGLTEDGPDQPEARKRLPMLEVLLELARILRSKRMKRGSLDFDLPEARVKVDDETGEPIDVYRSRSDPGVRQAYNLVEEMMLLANEVVAQDLGKRGVPAIYRVHGAPDPMKVQAFMTFARALGFPIVDEAAEDPRELSKFLKKIEGQPQAGPVSYLLLRAMQQATYDVTNIGHFGLAARDYLHFTSPIRRYPDLAVHRVVRMVARGERFEQDDLRAKLHVQATESSRLERRAMLAEREAVDVYRCILVRERVGEEFDATITSITPWGFYCAFDTPFVESLVPVEALGGDRFEPDELGVKLVAGRSGATYAIGGRVRVKIASVNVAERKILSAPVVLTRGLDAEDQDADRGDARPVAGMRPPVRRSPPPKIERGRLKTSGAKPTKKPTKKTGGGKGRGRR